MTPLTLPQIADLATRVGFPQSSLPVAVSVCLAESDGYPNAQNTNTDGSIDRGLWQINDRYHPQYDITRLFDPEYNARAALAISSGGTDFRLWSTVANRSYQRYLQAVYTALGVNMVIEVTPARFQATASGGFVRVRSLPTTDAPMVASKPQGSTVDVSGYAQAQSYTYGGATSSVWLRLADGSGWATGVSSLMSYTLPPTAEQLTAQLGAAQQQHDADAQQIAALTSQLTALQGQYATLRSNVDAFIKAVSA